MTAALALGVLGGCARPAHVQERTAAAGSTATAAVATPAERVVVGAPATAKDAAALAAPVATVSPTDSASAASAPPAESAPSAAASPPAKGPHILSVAASPKLVHAGDNVAWDVRTTADVVAVAAHVSVYTLPLQRTAPGRFKLNFAIPSNVPAIFHGTYNLDVIGKTGTGETTSSSVSLTFQ